MEFFNLIATPGFGKNKDVIKQDQTYYGQAKLSINANPLNGNFFLQDFSKTFITQGLQFEIGMVYNSQAKSPWRLNQGKSIGPVQGKINECNSFVILEDTEGHENTYTYDSKRCCYVNLSEAGGSSTLKYTADNKWEGLNSTINLKEFYNSNNRLEKITDLSGNELSYIYDETGRLIAISGKSGSEVSIKYGMSETGLPETKIYSIEGGHFDWSVLLASVVNTLANVGAKGLNIGPPAFNEAVATASASVASVGVDSMLGKDINAEAIAASTLGTFIGNQVAALAKQHYMDYQAKAQQDLEFKQEIKDLTNDYMQSASYHADEYGVFASTNTPTTSPSKPSTASRVPKPTPKKATGHDASQRNEHLKKDHAEQEARMTRSARWNAENSKATASQNGLWGVVNDVADSRVLNAIITGGDIARDALGSVLEEIGNEVIAIGAGISEASRAFGSGRIGEGLVTTEDLAVRVLPFALPFEKGVIAGARVVENEIRYGADVVSKLGWFGGRTVGEGERFVISETRVCHIFRDEAGHLPNTPQNHQLLKSVAENPGNTLGKDKFGNIWSAKTNSNGSQVWVQTRNGEIINGGLNVTPRDFHPQSGLSRPYKTAF